MNVARRLAVVLALVPIPALSPSAAAAPPVYVKHLKEGRTLTKARNYEAAIAALDRALVESPGDATALAARGYARLLSVPEAGPTTPAHRTALAAARADFDAALAATSDTALQGRIQHNLGLLAKREASATACAATVTRAQVGALHPTWVAAAAAWARLEPPVFEEDPLPKDEAAAKEALCRGGCSDARANGVALGGFDGVHVGAHIEVPGKGVWSGVLIDGWREYQCYPEGTATVKRAGGLWLIEASLHDPLIVGTDGDGNDCDPEDLTTGCMRGCFHHEVARTLAVVVDPATARGVRIEGPAGLPVKVDGRTVKVGACAPVSVDPPAAAAP